MSTFDPTVAPDRAWIRARPDPPDTPAGDGLRPPPEGFSDLRQVLPASTRFAIAYATAVNFVGAALPGYGAPGAWLRSAAADALARAAASFAQDGLQFIIYDAYRPVRATEAMHHWATLTDNLWLFDDGWVVRRSRHNLGRAVDLTLVDAKTGVLLDMGSPFDAFVDSSWTERATGRAAIHRARLRDGMLAAGFRGLAQEWWHFEWPHEEGDATPAGRCDVPYGVQEADGALIVP